MLRTRKNTQKIEYCKFQVNTPQKITISVYNAYKPINSIQMKIKNIVTDTICRKFSKVIVKSYTIAK